MLYSTLRRLMMKHRAIVYCWQVYVFYVIFMFAIWKIHGNFQLPEAIKLMSPDHKIGLKMKRPFNIVFKEVPHYVFGELNLKIKIAGSDNHINIIVKAISKNTKKSLRFKKQPIEKSLLYANNEVASSLAESSRKTETDIFQIKDYFNYLKSPTGTCRKLVRFGGSLNCNNRGDENQMDGNKMICMDDRLLSTKKSKNGTKCLVMSFGINRDSSFDEAIHEAGCEVHMFDIIDFRKDFWKVDYPNLHFHVMGLDTERHRTLFVKSNNTLIDYNNFNNIMVDLNLQHRLIHILKLDIEGYEWKVLEKSMIKKPFMNLIGQIAIEVHAVNFVQNNHTTEEIVKAAKYQRDCLVALERIGFHRVSYWDNNQPKYIYKDSSGNQFHTAGELLLVNRRWYDNTFWEELNRFL